MMVIKIEGSKVDGAEQRAAHLRDLVIQVGGVGSRAQGTESKHS